MIINLTPHSITVLGCAPPDQPDQPDQPTTWTIPSSGVARAAETSTVIGSIAGIPITRSVFGSSEGLPEPRHGTWLIVSTITAESARASGRECWDLLVPGVADRDATGAIVGVRSLRAVDPSEWVAAAQAHGIVSALMPNWQAKVLAEVGLGDDPA